MKTIVGRMTQQVERFAREIVDLPIPDSPTRLGNERKNWTMTALSEELREFGYAATLEDEADALLDMSYFALGRLVEMGLCPGPLFDAVHEANMAKERGELSKRPNSLGHDAIKPEGWKPPDLAPYLSVTREQLDEIVRKPKILVLGYARHGKDTVSEMLRDIYGFKFTSSSEFCAEHIVWPMIQEELLGFNFICYLESEGHIDKVELLSACRRVMKDKYDNYQECFEDRGSFRPFWYEAIAYYNHRDRTTLARGILEKNDVYCGLRSRDEMLACKHADTPLFDHIVWVDASKRVDPEGTASCTVGPHHADYIIDNNGDIDDLRENVARYMEEIGFVS